MDADVQRYLKAFPRHRETLLALERLLGFQARLAGRLGTAPGITEAAARETWREGRPLFSSRPPSIPAPLFQEALGELRPLLRPGQAAHAVLDHLSTAPLEPEELAGDIDAGIRRLAEATPVDADVVAGLLRIVFAPFFRHAAAACGPWIGTVAWPRGVCPICGSRPFMARLDRDDGGRRLACGLCGAEWRFDRLRCPFCEGDEPRLRYFTVDGDAAHRVECCDACRRYIKTVDERATTVATHLPAEDVITSGLDALAREQGYR